MQKCLCLVHDLVYLLYVVVGVWIKHNCVMTNEESKEVVQKDDMRTVIQFDGILHRFHRAELNPIRFGTKTLSIDPRFTACLGIRRDCGLLLMCYGGAFLVYHALFLGFWAFEKKAGLGEIWDAYFDDRTMMTGLLMSCWFVGYNLASYAIWATFEHRLERDSPPDDFEFVSAGEAFETGLGGADRDGEGSEDPKVAKMASQTLLVTMPSGELVLGTNTRSQSASSMLVMATTPNISKSENTEKNV